jgi:hypothetical protein
MSSDDARTRRLRAPLAVDLFCGLGGWTNGLLAEGYRVVGFDNERHAYGDARYPAQLVLQDVLTLHGQQFKDAALLVASPPCQAYSYRAMPWKRAKALPPPSNELFDACFRIQREACEAAGHHIPLVVENVCGAQKWVGRARWHYGSFYLWGDVPALMPFTYKGAKAPGANLKWSQKYVDQPGFKATSFNYTNEQRLKATKNDGGSWFAVAHNTTSGHGQNPDGRNREGVKFSQSGAAWFDGIPRDKMLGDSGPAAFGSKSLARKAASAYIAKIPLALARHIARAWKPLEQTA